MPGLDHIHEKIMELAAEQGRLGSGVRVSYDKDAGVIKIAGEGASALSLARTGMTDVMELAYSAAEHHPLWALLYRSAEIAGTALDGWDAGLDADVLDDVKWSVEELGRAREKLAGDRK
ncbi:conserved hypothetical protein [Cenarchaeum symbiosum A]|uniref:Uncharacterized protein n=1 Tax=Cenarchaeum symbiosum (strain A) TaxID=414004 RepID=A0RX97_CENSY|nr:conserved hypothetical protein [Cenarchaeum symbiosum A]